MQFLEYDNLTPRTIDLGTAQYALEKRSLTAKRCGKEVIG